MRRRPAAQATQNGQIWIVRVLIGTEPKSAQIAAVLRHASRIPAVDQLGSCSAAPVSAASD